MDRNGIASMTATMLSLKTTKIEMAMVVVVFVHFGLLSLMATLHLQSFAEVDLHCSSLFPFY